MIDFMLKMVDFMLTSSIELSQPGVDDMDT